MRWFRGRSEKQFKNKFRVKKSPKAPKAPAPNYKSPSHTKKAPKLRKPIVHRPFVEASFTSVAYSGPKDISAQALHQLEGQGSNSVKWVNQSASDGCENGMCRRLAAGRWRSVEDFLARRTLKTSPQGRPSAGEELGIYGYSHPGCDCMVIVSMADGSSYEVGPEDFSPRQVTPSNVPQNDFVDDTIEEMPGHTLPLPEGPEGTESAWHRGMERVSDELGHQGVEEEESFW